MLKIGGIIITSLLIFLSATIYASDVSDYKGSWEYRALQLQNKIDLNAPLGKASFLTTHNSYNAGVYSQNGSYVDPNQEISMYDQLEIGIRALEIDVHHAYSASGTWPWEWEFGEELKLSHGNGDIGTHPNDRYFFQGAAEIRDWLDLNPDEVLIIYIEDHMEGEYDEAIAVMDTHIGDLVYKPNGCQSLPMNISKADVLDAGKQILLIGGNCATGNWSNYVFNKTFSTISSSDLIPYPVCTAGNKDAAYFQSNLVRIYEDATTLSDWFGNPPPRITPEAAAEMVKSGIGAIGLDEIVPYDSRLKAQIWGWDTNEPNDDSFNENDCAVQRSNGRFNDIACSQYRNVACKDPNTSEWYITNDTYTWDEGASACEFEFQDYGLEFGIPVNGYENAELQAAKSNTGVSETWINYSELEGENTWGNSCESCIGEDVVWGVNSNNYTYRRNGSSWTRVDKGFKNVSIGADGTVWGVTPNEEIYRRDGSNWLRISGALKQISVGSASHVWGVNKNNSTYTWNGSSWTNVGKTLKYVSAGSDGTVWGIGPNDEIYRRDGNSWTRISGALKQISVGSANHVWGVNTNNSTYYWNGTSWTQVNINLKQVSAGYDGTVWGTNTSDEIFVQNGNGWVKVNGGLKQVSVGALENIPLPTMSVNISNAHGATSGSLNVGAATPLLNKFSFQFLNGDHHIKEVKALRGNNTVDINFQDNNGDDPYEFSAEYELRNNLPIYSVKGWGSKGTTTRTLASKPSSDHVFAIVGFRFKFSSDHHIRKIGAHESNGTITVVYEDKNWDDSYDWEIQYTYLPPEYVHSENTVREDNGGGYDSHHKDVPFNGSKILSGFYFSWAGSNDHHLYKLAVDLNKSRVNVKYTDDGEDEWFSWFVNYVNLK